MQEIYDFGMNDQENHDNTIVQEGVNGKRFFILNAPPISQESEKTAPDAALDTACNNNDTKGPTKLGGDGMVVRNAREMFENVDILSDGRYFCRVCNRAYKTHATLTAHLRGSHLRHESRCMEKDCKHVSFTENERRKHQKEHDKKRAKEFSMLTQSLERPDCLPISCKKALFEQILRHNKDVPGMVKSLTDTGKIKYTCSECNQSFGHAFHASRHSEVHQVFTSMTRFRNHANQEECEAAVCRNSEMRKDVNYGELPVGATTIDQDRFNFNFSRKRTALTDEQLQSGAEFDDKGRNSDETSSSAGSDATPNLTADASDIFGSNSMIMTEFGLKRLSDYKRTTEFRKRVLAEADNEYVEKKERHAPSRSQQYHHHQQQQQQNNASSRMEYIPPTIAYPYAPFVGKYPDLQPTPQHFLPTVYSQETQLSPPPPSLDQLHYDDEVEGFGRPMSADSEQGLINMEYYVSDNFPKDNGMGSDLLGNDGNKDPIYEELSKLQFVMPLADENECDEDLVDILNF